MSAGLLLAVAVHALAPREPVVVRDPAAEVVVVAGDAVLEGRVSGNVVVVFGDVLLSPTAAVEGDVVVLGGSVSGPGEVRGRRVVVGGRAEPDGTGWAWALLRLGFWSLAAFFALFLLPQAVRRTGRCCSETPLASIGAGLGLGVAWLALAVLGGVLIPNSLLPGFWLFMALVLVAVKLLGLVGVAWAFGKLLRPAVPWPLRGEFPRTGLAIVLLVAGSLLPMVGQGLWVAANLLGVGAAGLAFLPQFLPALLARRKQAVF